MSIEQVRSMDITYIPMQYGVMYLAAIIDQSLIQFAYLV